MDIKTLLIIGAGPNQLPAIELAKEKGYQVAVTDMNPKAEGFALADYYGVASTRDVDATIQYAKELNLETPLSGVMTMASESAVTVASVAKALGLPGVNPDAAWLATHKADRQLCFSKQGVPSPGYAIATNLEQGIEYANKMEWPVVLKPVDSAGSRGVQKVASSKELEIALAEIRNISSRPEYILEEFLIGTEHSIEGVVIDGEIFWTVISDRNYDKKEKYLPYFLEDGDTLPSRLTGDVVEQVKNAATKAVHSLGIDWGPVKGDILIDHNGPKVIEMAARLSGDYFCYVTAPLHNGINLLDIVMDLSLGIKVERYRLEATYNKGVALRYIWPEPGIITNISGVEEARLLPGVHFVKWEPYWKGIGKGSMITPAKSMGERVGCVMTFAASREEAVKIAENAINMIDIKTEQV